MKLYKSHKMPSELHTAPTSKDNTKGVPKHITKIESRIEALRWFRKQIPLPVFFKINCKNWHKYVYGSGKIK